MTARTVRLPTVLLHAELAAANAAQRTAAVTFYTGLPVERADSFDGEYLLTFDLAGADLKRFNAGAPLTRDHSHKLEDQVGVITRAWVADGAAHAIVRFSDRAEVDALWGDVRSGVIKNVSMEARILELEDVTKRGGRKAYVARKWQPMALAIVPVGADPGAQMAALSQHPTHECVIIGGNMSNDNLDTTTDDDAAADDPRPTREELRAENRELRRRERIREIGESLELGEVWSQGAIKDELSIKDAIADARKEAARRSPQIDGRLTIGNEAESPGFKAHAMGEALSARALGREPEAAGRRYYGRTVAECAFETLKWSGRSYGLDAHRGAPRVVQLAMGTSDFPGVLANVLNKTLLPAYMAATPSYRLIAQQRQFRDYRPHRFVRLGDFPLPLLVGEGGEITEGAVGESSETVTALKYGRILNILWETLVNDDVGAFADFGGMVARRIVDRENALFYATCILAGAGLGPNLADGVAVHNAAHGNVNSAGALSNDRLNEAFGLMAAQTSIDGLKLNVPPRYVLTSPTSHILARTLLAPITPAQASQVNPFAGLLMPIYDANLTGTRYYVIADPAQVTTFIYGTVGGVGPRFEVRPGWEIEGVQVKAVHDFGCGAIEYRGSVSGAGS